MSENDKSPTKEPNPFDAQYGDWLTDFNKKEGDSGNNSPKNKIEWLKFDKPGKFKVRLIGKYVIYKKHYKPFGNGARVITHKSYKNEDPAWKAGFYPMDSFAIQVIDRSDGKLKILDKGRKLFEYFFDYGTANSINPAGPQAPNFEIKVEWPNGNKKRAKYSAVASGGPAPLTDEEKQMVVANKVSLGQIYRATPLEKIKQLWEAVPEQYRVPQRDEEDDDGGKTSTKSSPKTETVATPPPAMEESMEKAPAEDDDLFGDNKKDDSTSW